MSPRCGSLLSVVAPRLRLAGTKQNVEWLKRASCSGSRRCVGSQSQATPSGTISDGTSLAAAATGLVPSSSASSSAASRVEEYRESPRLIQNPDNKNRPVQHLRLGRFLRQEHIERAAMEFTKAQEACTADPYPVNDTLLPYTTKFCYWRFIGITKKELHQQTNIDLDANTVAWVFPRSRMQDIGGEALRRWETGYSKTRSQEFVIRECIRELIQDSIYAVVEFREKKEARKRDKEGDYHLEGKRISGQKRRLEGIIVEKMRVQILEELVGRRGFVGLDVAGIAPLWSKERLLEIRRECCVVGTGDGSPEEPDGKLLHEKLVAEMGLKEDSLRRLEIVNEPRKEAREAKAREERRKWRLERERLEREQFELKAAIFRGTGEMKQATSFSTNF